MISSKYKNMSLEQLQADLSQCEIKIASQLEENKRTEGFIFTFKDCLRQQNEVLNIYILERYKLKEERKSLQNLETTIQEASSISDISTNEIEHQRCKQEIQSTRSLKGGSSVSEFSTAYTEDTSMNEEKSSLKRSWTDDIKNALVTKKICNNNLSLKDEKVEKLKGESIASQSLQESDGSSMTPRRKLNQFNYTNIVVHQIIGFRHVVYICGSQGLLHMITGNEIAVLNTQTTEDITQMTLFKYGSTSSLSLAAFSGSYLILFIDILKIQVPELKLISVRGKIYVGKEVIYMPMVNGELKKLNKEDCSIINHIEHSHGNIRLYVPCYGVNKKRALISLEDKKLYKTLENDLDILETVEGIKNVKNLFRIGKDKYVCSSKRKLWILNSEPAIIETMKLNEDIKYIQGSKNFIVMISDNNTLIVFKVQNEVDSVKKLQEQKFECNITGMSLENSKIHLMMSGEIVTLKINT